MKTNASLFSGFGLAIVGTTCCALPITLVALGMGSAVASLVSAVPWIATLSEYKAITFSLTGVILAYCFWRLNRATTCEMNDKHRLRWQRVLLWSSTFIYCISIFAAYALLPLTLWFNS